MRLLWALATIGIVSGCVDVYESGSPTPIECETTYNTSELDDGVPNPLRCERVNETDDGTTPPSGP